MITDYKCIKPDLHWTTVLYTRPCIGPNTIQYIVFGPMHGMTYIVFDWTIGAMAK